MNRRTAIRQFLVLSAAVSFVPACLEDRKKPEFPLKNISVDEDQAMVLAELSETIIPKTETPGAKDISAHLFVLKMVDDCYDTPSQKKFTEGFDAFEKLTRKSFDKSFIQCSEEERSKLLTRLESLDGKKDDAAGFYCTVKRLTVQAFTTSEVYLTKMQVYELNPARFHGCVPLKEAS